MIYAGPGNDAISVSGKGATIDGGTGTNSIGLTSKTETIVLQQGGIASTPRRLVIAGVFGLFIRSTRMLGRMPGWL